MYNTLYPDAKDREEKRKIELASYDCDFHSLMIPPYYYIDVQLIIAHFYQKNRFFLCIILSIQTQKIAKRSVK